MKLLATILLLLAALPNAHADYFYWVNTPLKTRTVSTGFSFAVTALRAESAGNVQRKPGEVTGTIGRTYVAITCVNSIPLVTAVVAAVGPDNAEAQRVRDAVSRRIASVINLD